MRHAPRIAAALAATFAASLPAATAQALTRPTLHCKAADLRYPFMAGGPKAFGVFELRITGGTCATAHRIAKSWMKAFEANVKAGSEKTPRSAGGFTFTTLPATAAQTLPERGRRGTTSLRFDYRIPSG